MQARPDPTLGVLSARLFAATVRIVVAGLGGLILLTDPSAVSHPVPAALGLGVIALTGVLEALVRHERWLRAEEAFSCTAVLLIVTASGGETNAITLLWLVAAATGVLARGGRVGSVGRVVVLGALIAPIVIEGPSAERIGLAAGSILMLLAVGRISRETGGLLEAAEYRAAHDELTDLLSRSAFAEAVDEMAGNEHPVTVVILDLDAFGALNKRHGSVAGDAVLSRIGADLRDRFPAVTLARLGEDQIAALADTDDPGGLAERLSASIARSGGAFNLTARAGYAVAPRDGTTAEGLTTAAEVALRVAKRTVPEGSVLPYQGATVTGSRDGARATLDRLCGGEGLEVVVQPIVDVHEWTTHAYEALARFPGVAGGPLQWLALAEEFGMRADLELACLRKALELLPQLPGDAQLSVNLSAPLLVQGAALDLLDAHEDLSGLIVEVTEDVLVRQGPEVERATEALRRRGALFAVDDIGAGYAGLGQLAALRPTYLKLDRALVTGIDTDPGLASLVHLLGAYGRSVGGLVVAEGVETEAELEVVVAAGVALVQGYLLGRPAPPWPEIAARPGAAPLTPAAG